MLNRSFQRGLFLFLGGFFLTACSRSSEPNVAKVGTIALPLSEYQRRLHEMNPSYQQYAATPEGRRQFLELLIREKVVISKARDAGVQRDAEYRKRLATFHRDIRRRLDELKQNLLFEIYIRKLQAGEIGVTDADVEAYYRNHLEDYQSPKEIQASHILVSTKIEAEEVLARLAKGESFEKLARDLSKDPTTAANGGRLAPVRTSSLMPEALKQAIYQLKEGKVSVPVETEFGYHILKKTGTKSLPPRHYDQAKEEIRERLERLKFDEWVERTRKSIKITIDESVLRDVPSTAPTSQNPKS